MRNDRDLLLWGVVIFIVYRMFFMRKNSATKTEQTSKDAVVLNDTPIVLIVEGTDENGQLVYELQDTGNTLNAGDSISVFGDADPYWIIDCCENFAVAKADINLSE